MTYIIKIRLVIAPHASSTLKAPVALVSELQSSLMTCATARIGGVQSILDPETLDQAEIVPDIGGVDAVLDKHDLAHILGLAAFPDHANAGEGGCVCRAGTEYPAIKYALLTFAAVVDVVLAVVVNSEGVRGGGRAGEDFELAGFFVHGGSGKIVLWPFNAAVGIA
jgi:hypothetical protein